MEKNPKVAEINHRWVRFLFPFAMQSDVLRKYGIEDGIFVIPAGFVCDRESVPIIRGTSIRGGYAHDYFYRYDSVPVVTHADADAIYWDIMNNRGNPFWRRFIKWAAVRCVGFRYFHRYSVSATYRDLSGKER